MLHEQDSGGGLPSTGRRAPIDRLNSRITVRIIPFLVWIMILATMDRQNVGYAKLTMLADLRFSETVFGLGAGVFFIGYALFGIPVSLLIRRLGVRVFLGGICVLWGAASLSNAWVTTAAGFYTVRFLMGVFEAGILPAVLYYVSQWFPTTKRGSVIATFAAGSPIAAIVGAPISGYILRYFGDVDGHASWQWLFVLEALPAMLTGIWCLFFLSETPAGANWLSEPERRLLSASLAADLDDHPPAQSSLADCLRSPMVWLLSATNFCLLFGSTALQFWTPTVIREIGETDPLMIGVTASGMSALGIVSMIAFGRRSDRRNERSGHAAFAFASGAAALVATGFLLHSPFLSIVMLAVATASTFSAYGPYWAIPSSRLSGPEAVPGIALVGTVGVVAGFVAQAVIGFTIDRSGSSATGLCLTGLAMLMGAILVSRTNRSARAEPVAAQI